MEERFGFNERCVAAHCDVWLDHGMWWVMFGLWCVGVTVLSAIPGGSVDIMTFSYADKVAHFGLFFVGAFLLAAAMRRSFRWAPWVAVPVVALIMAALGAADEWHQLHTPGRSGGDMGDWIANSLGGISGAVALYAWHGFVRLLVRSQPDPIAPTAD